MMKNICFFLTLDVCASSKSSNIFIYILQAASLSIWDLRHIEKKPVVTQMAQTKVRYVVLFFFFLLNECASYTTKKGPAIIFLVTSQVLCRLCHISSLFTPELFRLSIQAYYKAAQV